jgi:hypothetical protein
MMDIDTPANSAGESGWLLQSWWTLGNSIIFAILSWFLYFKLFDLFLLFFALYIMLLVIATQFLGV